MKQITKWERALHGVSTINGMLNYKAWLFKEGNRVTARKYDKFEIREKELKINDNPKPTLCVALFVGYDNENKEVFKRPEGI